MKRSGGPTDPQGSHPLSSHTPPPLTEARERWSEVVEGSGETEGHPMQQNSGHSQGVAMR